MKTRVYITKLFSFEAAHKLTHYEGDCKNLHGHSYKLRITVSGFINKDGLVIDFKKLKNIVNEQIIKTFDHKYLNDVLNLEDVTAENMVILIWEKLEKFIESNNQLGLEIRVENIRLYETENSYAEVRRE